MWRQSHFGHGTLLAADGHLIALSDSGDLSSLARRLIATRRKAPKDGVLQARPAWTVPVLHNGVLFLRDSRRPGLALADGRN